MAYDLTKLVKVSALKQLAERIKLHYYNKYEIDTKLQEFIKQIELNNEILEAIDQVVSISITPGTEPGTLLINGEEITIPGITGEDLDLITVINSLSTDDQIPSARAVYNALPTWEHFEPENSTP